MVDFTRLNGCKSLLDTRTSTKIPSTMLLEQLQASWLFPTQLNARRFVFRKSCRLAGGVDVVLWKRV
jgi:hypothetical protein